MITTQKAESIYNKIDSLSKRQDWSIYYYDELMSDIKFVHDTCNDLVALRDNEDKCMGIDNCNKLENYIEICSNLENTISKAIYCLRNCIDFNEIDENIDWE